MQEVHARAPTVHIHRMVYPACVPSVCIIGGTRVGRVLGLGYGHSIGTLLQRYTSHDLHRVQLACGAHAMAVWVRSVERAHFKDPFDYTILSYENNKDLKLVQFGWILIGFG